MIKSNMSIELSKSKPFLFNMPVNLAPYLDEDWYEFQPNDEIQFFLTAQYNAYDNAIFRKVRVVDKVETQLSICITPDDIKNLPLGRYYYSIVITTSNFQLLFVDSKECTIAE